MHGLRIGEFEVGRVAELCSKSKSANDEKINLSCRVSVNGIHREYEDLLRTLFKGVHFTPSQSSFPNIPGGLWEQFQCNFHMFSCRSELVVPS